MTGFVVVGGALLLLVAFMLWLPGHLRRHPEQRGSGGAVSGLVGGFDEVYAPTAHDARRALDEEHHLVQPAPTPDGDKGISGGRVRIELREE